MSAKIKYTNEPIEAKVVRDFLPPPEELAFREEGVKVTIALSKQGKPGTDPGFPCPGST